MTDAKFLTIERFANAIVEDLHKNAAELAQLRRNEQEIERAFLKLGKDLAAAVVILAQRLFRITA